MIENTQVIPIIPPQNASVQRLAAPRKFGKNTHSLISVKIQCRRCFSDAASLTWASSEFIYLADRLLAR
jgi:hypothetical protein